MIHPFIYLYAHCILYTAHCTLYTHITESEWQWYYFQDVRVANFMTCFLFSVFYLYLYLYIYLEMKLELWRSRWSWSWNLRSSKTQRQPFSFYSSKWSRSRIKMTRMTVKCHTILSTFYTYLAFNLHVIFEGWRLQTRDWRVIKHGIMNNDNHSNISFANVVRITLAAYNISCCFLPRNYRKKLPGHFQQTNNKQQCHNFLH